MGLLLDFRKPDLDQFVICLQLAFDRWIARPLLGLNRRFRDLVVLNDESQSPSQGIVTKPRA